MSNVDALSAYQPSLAPSSTTLGTYTYPPHYSFPPFFTLQPNPSTRQSQLSSWSSFIQSYCRHQHLFTLTLVDAIETPLFYNRTTNRRLNLQSATEVIQWMTTEAGGQRAEWTTSTSKASGQSTGRCYIYWRRPEEWAEAIHDWVDETGQKGVVLTLYELTESDAVSSQEFAGMEPDLLDKALGVLVKRGKAQIFGEGEGRGVKFF